ncbi:MAG: hypothetical protein ABI863_14095 [Ginsengibacter sp.]
MRKKRRVITCKLQYIPVTFSPASYTLLYRKNDWNNKPENNLIARRK